MRFFINFLFITFLIISFAYAGDYKRDNYEHWIDADKDGQDTRQEVLIQESLIPVVFDDDGKVALGIWYCVYTGRIIVDPSEVHIDHVVALANADRSGANKWTKKKKKEFANMLDDPHYLIAVDGKANIQKSDKNPSEWIPKDLSLAMLYIHKWVYIKEREKLCYEKKEMEFLNEWGFPVDNLCDIEL